MSRAIHLLANLGPKSEAWLAEVGIHDERQLREIGAVAAYARLKHAFPADITLNALWALHGALAGIPWRDVCAETKGRLLRELQAPGVTG